MLLFRYFATHVFETLLESRLKVARISGLNDPFECRFVPTRNVTRKHIRIHRNQAEKGLENLLRKQGVPELKVKQIVRRSRRATNQSIQVSLEKTKTESLEEQAQILEDDIRVLCFSGLAPERHDEILMWSHYTNGHRGGRIGFEIPTDIGASNLRPMTYSDKRVVVDFTELEGLEGFESIKRALIQSTERKSSRWSYEDEYRLFTCPENCQREGFLEFFPFEKSWVCRVDLGLRFPIEEKKQLLNILSSHYPGVNCYQANFHPTDYALIYNKLPGTA